MLRFSKLEKYELLEVQHVIEDIYRLKKNNYISDLNEGEKQEIKFYKELFEDIAQDFRNIEI